uniref:Uncharacterized protein n=1 Tax=Oryza punctata TaxID=4537 RepID=A0A0E0LZK0_ORYPU
MVTADEQQQPQQQHKQRSPPPPQQQGQHQQQQKPFILLNKKRKCALVVASEPATTGDKQGTKPEQIVPGAGSSSRTTPQIGERRRTSETGSKSAGKQTARRDGPLQVCSENTMQKENAGRRRGRRPPRPSIVVAGDADEDRQLSRTCYIQRASNANLVFKVVNTGGRDGSIVKLREKPKAIMASTANPKFLPSPVQFGI